MVVGIPGTGIGGLFYILMALWMPVRELYLKMKRRGSERGRAVVHQFCITLGIVAGMWATGEFFGIVLALGLGVDKNVKSASHLSAVTRYVHNFLHLTPFLLTLGVLISVYVAVLVLRLFMDEIDAR